MNISFSELKRLLKESTDNHFKVGCKYTWWSRNWNWTGGSFVVVDIAPDRSYLLEVTLGSKTLAAYKYKIISDGNGGEKISDHPAPYAWRVARADKGGEFVGVPDGWYSQETKNRKEGAAKASKTRSIKGTLQRISKNITPKHFFEIMAARFPDDFKTWEDAERLFVDKFNIDINAGIESLPVSKVRWPMTSRGKLIDSVLLFYKEGGHQIYIGYDGERFYADWDSFSKGVSDEEIREILSDII